jgi:hypothetical protein
MKINRESLKQTVRDHIEPLCNRYLSQGSKVRGQWVVGNISRDSGQSLKIDLEGEKAGVYHDFATGEGGDFIELVQRITGRPCVEVAHEIGSIG